MPSSRRAALGESMPRKERPAPLSDSIFRAKLSQTAGPAAAPEAAAEEAKDDITDLYAHLKHEAIPVHNTFIQFGAPEGLAGSEKKGLTTAPAWVGPSFQSVVQSVVESVVQEPEPPPPPEGSAGTAASEASSSTAPEKLGTPKKVPVMRYSLSASSARAAGLAGNSAVVASYQLDRPGSGSNTGTTQDPGGEKNGEEDDVEDDDDEGGSGDESPRRSPAAPPGELPSIGSAKHAEGLCKRCCFFPKGRCLNGQNCDFCHFDHEKRKRKKKKKSKQKDSGSDAEVSTPSNGMQQPNTGDSLCNPMSLAGLPLRPPPLEPAPGPVDPALYGLPALGPYDPMLWAGPQPVSGLPLTAPPAMPPQGVPLPCEPPAAPYMGQGVPLPCEPPTAPCPGQAVPLPCEAPTAPCPGQALTAPAAAAAAPDASSYASGYGAAIATAAFVLDGQSPGAADRAASGAGGNCAGPYGGFGEVKVPTYAPLPDATLRAYAAAASGLQANGTVPPAPPPAFGRPPPR